MGVTPPAAAGTPWQSLLPEGVHACAGFDTLPAGALSATESRSIAGAGDYRLTEFMVGRRSARCALAALGRPEQHHLPRLAGGAPAWPPGVVGSIAHTTYEGRPFAFAAVADEAAYDGLGVDVEAPGRIEAGRWPGIFLPPELDALLLRPVPLRQLAASLRWSAKEAVFKAWGGQIALGEIAVALDDDTGHFFFGRSLDDLAACVGRTLAVDGGWVFAVAWRARVRESIAACVTSAVVQPSDSTGHGAKLTPGFDILGF